MSKRRAKEANQVRQTRIPRHFVVCALRFAVRPCAPTLTNETFLPTFSECASTTPFAELAPPARRSCASSLASFSNWAIALLMNPPRTWIRTSAPILYVRVGVLDGIREDDDVVGERETVAGSTHLSSRLNRSKVRNFGGRVRRQAR